MPFGRGSLEMRTAIPQKLAYWTAVLTLGIAAIVVVYAVKDNSLIPGPIAPAHSTLSDNCSGCHTNVEDGRLGWLHGLVRYADPLSDAKACLACHKMGEDATHAHTLSVEDLEAVSERRNLDAIDDGRSAAARLQKFLFPLGEHTNTQVFCATCHKEHRPEDGKLSAVPDGRCHSCHKVQFEHFAKDHPDFGDYPFRRRARIVFDHAQHFGERFPEMAEKKPDLKIPKRCADCHTSTADKRHMAVKPFSETCSGCHLPQIVGAERATGPKGVALLALPEIDLATLKEKNVNIGSWPGDSEAELTPLMKLLLGRDPESRALLQAVDKLDLVDLSDASDEDISAVAAFVWEVKALFSALATSKPSEAVSGAFGSTPDGADAERLSKLLAAMPQDVVLGAQREWLPNLEEEMAERPEVKWAPTVKRAASGAPETDKKTEAAPDISEPPANEEPPDQLVTDRNFGTWGVDPFGELVQAGDTSKELARAEEASEDIGVGEEEVAPDDRTPVGAEEWAELGGWYRGDYTIYYKPTGHADAFLRAWLEYTGRLYDKSNGDVASSVFDLLTSEDAQGQCTKCHSIDAGPKGSRVVQWHPSSLADKSRIFTKFVHEPHFPLLDKRGCLTCHKLNNAKDFEDAYRELDPAGAKFNFKPVAKKICANCHKESAARQNCSLCHNYHITPVVTPITRTRLPKM